MSAPDYSDAQIDARSFQRQRFAPGTRVRHSYTGAAEGTVTKLHAGSLKRQKPLSQWRASVRWDSAPADQRPTVHALALLRADGRERPPFDLHA